MELILKRTNIDNTAIVECWSWKTRRKFFTDTTERLEKVFSYWKL